MDRMDKLAGGRVVCRVVSMLMDKGSTLRMCKPVAGYTLCPRSTCCLHSFLAWWLWLRQHLSMSLGSHHRLGSTRAATRTAKVRYVLRNKTEWVSIEMRKADDYLLIADPGFSSTYRQGQCADDRDVHCVLWISWLQLGGPRIRF